ncbi:hypothetical protein ACFLZR_01220 [Candidatus Neomarinimicrobiota bacterium]
MKKSIRVSGMLALSLVFGVGLVLSGCGQSEEETPAPGGGFGGGGFGGGAAQQPPLDPEVAAAVWELQARTVASEFNLNSQNTTRLVEAYTDVRSRLSGAGGGGGSDVQFREYTQFVRLLRGFLSESQTGQVAPALGSFDQNWDRLVAAIVDLGLNQQAQAQALDLVRNYSVNLSEALLDANRQMRTAIQIEHRANLDAALSRVLNASQMQAFAEAIPAPEQPTAGGGGAGGGN